MSDSWTNHMAKSVSALAGRQVYLYRAENNHCIAHGVLQEQKNEQTGALLFIVTSKDGFTVQFTPDTIYDIIGGSGIRFGKP